MYTNIQRALLMETTIIQKILRILKCKNIMSTTLLLTPKLFTFLVIRDNNVADSKLYHSYSRDQTFKSPHEILQSVFAKHKSYTQICLYTFTYGFGNIYVGFRKLAFLSFSPESSNSFTFRLSLLLMRPLGF